MKKGRPILDRCMKPDCPACNLRELWRLRKKQQRQKAREKEKHEISSR